MPTITFPKKELKSYLKGDVSDDQLQHAISMLGTDLESFGKEIKVEIFPNRPDLLSVVGIARALNHFLDFTSTFDHYEVKKGTETVRILPSARKATPHTRAFIARNLKFSDEAIKEIIEIQEKLHITFGRNRKKMSMGIYPLEAITFPITFGAEKPKNIVFHPLESENEMNGSEILDKHPTGKKYAHLLSSYSSYPVFRDSSGAVLSMPPIINSHATGRITENTRDVFVECSGHQEHVLEQTMQIVACALIDMGAEVESVTMDYGSKQIISPNLATKKITVDLKYMSGRSGVPEDQLIRSLKKLGVSLTETVAHIPPYRVDFLHQVDVATDAAIGFGYDNVIPRASNLSTIGQLDNNYVLAEQIRDVLSGSGILEAKNYCITREGIRLLNPLTEEYTSLRTEILTQLLDTLQENTQNTYPQQFFEIGTVFKKNKSTETGIEELENLSVVQCGEHSSYTTIRQILEAVSRSFEWKISFLEHEDPRFISGRCAKINGDVSGIVGEIHPELIVARRVGFPVVGFEITLPKY